MNALTWMAPTLLATLMYGVGQGLVKRNIADVPPGRFCLYLVAAKAVVNLGFFFTQEHPDPFSAEGRAFFAAGLVAYILDGAAWVLYFESIVAGPITIVGTLSAAYPALTVLFARMFLGEALSSWQYLGLLLVIGACIGLSYAPFTPDSKVKSKKWIPLAASALVLWGTAQTIVKWSYSLPLASEPNLALYNTFGGALTLGVYGLWTTRRMRQSRSEWAKSALPMGMMAGGDLAVIIASRLGPISVVTPLSGAYPVVTLAFAWAVLKERITRFQWLCIVLIIVGMFLSPGAS
jgi:drug/metabolite transporter (DMT)-like permease